MPFVLVLILLFLVLGGMVGGVVLAYRAVFGFARRMGAPPDRSRIVEEARERYPDRLGELEAQLEDSYERTLEQIARLEARHEEVRAKGGSEVIAERYARDRRLLQDRAERLRRVMALVWRTRAVLSLRAHLAETARRRPMLDGLPGEDEASEAPLDAIEAYEAAADRVRRFVVEIENQAAKLGEQIPEPPAPAEVTVEDRRLVEQERARVHAICASLQVRMDQLADTLQYLAERRRTRSLVDEAPEGGFEADAAGGRALFEELETALGELAGLVEVGDRAMSDTALDHLAKDIGRLERAALDARDEADAALEVERIVEQLAGSSA